MTQDSAAGAQGQPQTQISGDVGILAGLKVIDAASFLAGPCATTIMGDYGADVIKVEPLTGDRQRTISGGHHIDHSWQLTGRNKRSIALNIASDQGRDVLLRMLEDTDVIVFNFRADQLRKYGLTFDELAAVNPRLIVGQISGYGLQGDDANKPAFDLTGWFARTGILDMMHNKDALPPPPAGGVGDHATAMALFGGIMLALKKREQTGAGSFVSTSLAACGTWANGLALQAAMTGVDHAARRDDEGWSNPFTNVYATKDKRNIVLAVQNMKRDWPVLANALGKPEWLEDDRFQGVRRVFKNRHAAKTMISDAFAAMSLAEIQAALTSAGIVHAAVQRNSEVIEDPQLIANGVIVATDSTEPGYDRALATPVSISGSPQRIPGRAPEIGAHTRALLLEHGYREEQIDALLGAAIAGGETDKAGGEMGKGDGK